MPNIFKNELIEQKLITDIFYLIHQNEKGKITNIEKLEEGEVIK